MASGIRLMPVYSSPAYHGYAASDYYRVEPQYGDNDSFRRFVGEAHGRGIHVVVDLALNHTSEKHPWFEDSISSPDADHRDWYVWSAEDPGCRGPGQRAVWFLRNGAYYYAFFGSALPDLNPRNEAVAAQMHDVARFWLEEVDVDGFHLDAVRHLIEEGQDQESTVATLNWLRGFRKWCHSIRPFALTIGEVTGPTSERLLYYDGQVDMCSEFDWASGTISGLNQGDPSDLESTQSFVHPVYPEGQYGTFLALQDQDRVISQPRDSQASARLAVTLPLTSPGVPFLFYGEEIGMRGTKPGIYIRRPMQWANAPRAGFSTGRPWMDVDLNYDLANVETESSDPSSLLSHYRRLIQLRGEYAALRSGEWILLSTSNPAIYAYLRSAGGSTLLVLLNFAEQPAAQAELSCESSPLAVGEYQATDLLTGKVVAPLSVLSEGRFHAYIALPSVEPLTGYVFSMAKENDP